MPSTVFLISLAVFFNSNFCLVVFHDFSSLIQLSHFVHILLSFDFTKSFPVVFHSSLTFLETTVRYLRQISNLHFLGVS